VALQAQEGTDGHQAVYVTLNYRLGIFGFLGGDALRQPAGHNSTGNWGLQDQRLALKWVQGNIAAFGGDPSRVMIIGQSAGAGSVASHMVAPRSFGLFKRAAMHSGAFSTWISQNLPAANSDYHAALKSAACPVHTGLSCLRNITAEALLQISSDLNDWGPTVDGVEINDDPWRLVRQGAVAPDVEVLAGSVSEDATYGNYPSSVEEFPSWIETNLGLNTTISKQLARIYVGHNPPPGPDTSEPPAYWAGMHLLADAEMACPARRTARWLHNLTKAFVFRFEHTPRSAAFGTGASHSSDIPFAWHVLRCYPGHDCSAGAEIDAKDPQEVALSKQMVNMWSTFAATGEPSTGAMWPPYDPDSDMTMVLDVKAQGGLRAKQHVRKVQCDFWDTVIELAPMV